MEREAKHSELEGVNPLVLSLGKSSVTFPKMNCDNFATTYHVFYSGMTKCLGLKRQSSDHHHKSSEKKVSYVLWDPI